jgi:hypothetical protein
MSTPISERRQDTVAISRLRRKLAAIGFLTMALAVAGCEPGVSRQGADRTVVTVSGQPVTIAAPRGFCVDHTSTTVNSAGAFVLVGDCALLGAAQANGVPVGAVLTASVSSGFTAGVPAEQTLSELEEFFGTARGRAIVGRSGDAARTRVLQTRTRNNVLYVLVEDRGQQRIPGVEQRFWRAFLDVSDRMVALSVLGFQGAGVGPEQGLAYLQSFADAIQRANGIAAPAPAS